MQVEARTPKRDGSKTRKPGKKVVQAKKRITFRDLGWTRGRAREVRAKLATFAADWDDPRMDVYDEH